MGGHTGGFSTGAAGNDTLIDIEWLAGSDFDDVLTGNSGNNYLRGDGGADVLNGGGQAPNSTANGFGGDWADYFFADIGITADLSNSANNTGEAKGDTYISIESLRGGSFNDTLRGDGGNNQIRGGLGNDTIDGGAGNDTADYFSASNSVTVLLTNLLSGHTGGSSSGADGIDTLIDIESIVGSFFNDTLTGNDQDNVINGEDGNDVIDGGAGNDTASYIDASGAVQVTLGEGAGAGSSTGAAGNDTLTNIENITGSEFNDTLTGNSSGNVINARGGDDTLKGLAGNDTLNGGSGIDTADYSAASGAVNVTLTDLISGSTGGSSTGAAGSDTLVDIENVLSGTGDDTLIGNDQNNVLNGGGGNDFIDAALGDDTLNGGSGNDTLLGRAGTNTMSGGAGDDVYYVQGVNDIVTELAGEGTDTIYAYASFALAATSEIEGIDIQSATGITVMGSDFGQFFSGGAGDDVINGQGGFDTINGGAGDDTLNGGSGADTLNGQSGTNTMAGGTGDDLYYVQGVNDVVTEAAGEGYDAVYAYASFALSAASEIEYIDIQSATGISVTGSDTQQFIVGGVGDDTINGAGGVDVINGGNGNDTISGGSGNDLLYGAGGNDSVSGNAGDDILLGNSGTNTLIGGTGNDSYYVQGTNDIVTELAGEGFDAVYAFASFTLAASSEVEFIGVQTATGLTITGSDLGQVIYGLSGDDNLDGGGGNDTLNGSSGNDIVSGGAGDDNIYGSLGNDTLNGNGGNDTLVGDSGTNTMAGGAGDDNYYVDGTNDVVNEVVGEGFDRIYATSSFALSATSEVEYMYNTSGPGISMTGSDTAQLIIGNTGNDRIKGAGGIDTIYGGFGADTFVLTNVAGGFDNFEDFVSGTDFLEISAAQFGGGLAAGSLTAGQFTANAAGTFSNTTERFVYNTSNHQLIYDADGNGGANSSVLIAIFDVGTPVIGDFKVV